MTDLVDIAKVRRDGAYHTIYGAYHTITIYGVKIGTVRCVLRNQCSWNRYYHYYVDTQQFSRLKDAVAHLCTTKGVMGKLKRGRTALQQDLANLDTLLESSG